MRSSPTPRPTARISTPPSCRTGSAGNKRRWGRALRETQHARLVFGLASARPNLRLVIRVHQLEARPAFELARGGLAGRGIGFALARLAQEMRLDHQVALGGVLVAALLDEDAAADRGFARRQRKIRA